jgi:hypothetical protein
MNSSDMQYLFNKLYFASTESEVDKIIQGHDIFKDPGNWRPYGATESNYSVIENQQASPIPALVEKLTNSIDAMLMKRCYEQGIDPSSGDAPQTMDEAIRRFYQYENFDLQPYRTQVAQDIQVLADGPKLNTSIIIYDDGEGQHPQEFANTFLSLLRGNKSDIKFVQGKYNMGGAGAIVYCGENRYQLIGSKRFDGTGNFGFTVVRMHHLTSAEEKTKKNTYYEYFCPEGQIPEFSIDEIDLKLYKRKFKTGTVIKLYSYDLPSGSRSVISRDLNQSLNEYLHNPALPLYTIDKKERYPDDRNLERVMYGLSKRLLDQKDKYVDRQFTLDIDDADVGNLKVAVTVFKIRNEDKPVKEFKETIQREFFKNNMSMAFSLNGQVHGFYTSEFITRALKFQILKDYLLIHVDCTHVKLHYRNNLFMASRDRLKHGKESDYVRNVLARKLKQSELNDIYKARKDSFSADTEDTNELLKTFSKNLPMNPEMMKLLNKAFKLDQLDKPKEDEKKKKNEKPEKAEKKEKNPFESKRFPSIFLISGKPDNECKIVKTIPLGGDKTIKFDTDVENEYFDRVRDRGDLTLYVLDHAANDSEGGDKPGKPKEITDFFEVVKSSPQEGTIRVNLQPQKHLKVGDELEIQAKLSSVVEPEGALESVFYVKLVEEQKKQPKDEGPEPLQLGLPQLVLVYKDEREGVKTWKDLEPLNIAIDDYEIMATLTNEKDELEKIFINMDSHLLRSYKSALDGEDKLRIADNKYVSQIYFHTLFLYAILRQRNYTFSLGSSENETEKTIDEVLQDLFKTSYGEFLLKFGGTEELMTVID